VVVLHEIERAGGRDLGGDAARALCSQGFLAALEVVGGLAQRVTDAIDRGMIGVPTSFLCRMPSAGL
jgi:hypothetical protein